MPINGRNFLDIAQLEPGVQIQDGSNFDPHQDGVLFDLLRWSFRSHGAH